MKALLNSLFVLAAVAVPFAPVFAQELSTEVEEAILAEIKALHAVHQEAFIEGDCEKVISFYDQNATFFAGGRTKPSPEARLKFCSQIPRPFRSPNDRKPEIEDRFYLLSENAAYQVRTIDSEPEGEDPSVFKREVVTKIWARTAEGWKIVHFHASTHSVSKN